mmetsp:Transcript_20002/g.46147  ORF Transcript_20002/g.46147 Transcript_20002/m.46147 type:complete len:278 (+) Transcript_20002:284-1117(+)
MLLFPRRELDLAACAAKRVGRDHERSVFDFDVVELGAAARHQAPDLRLGLAKLELHEEIDERHSRSHVSRRELHARQRVGGGRAAVAPKERLGGLLYLRQAVLAVQHACRLVCEHHLGLVNGRAGARLQLLDLFLRQLCKDAQESADICIGSVAPKLPVLEWGEQVLVKPNCAARGLAHLFAVSGGQQRRGQPKERSAVYSSRELDAVDDVAPLVRASKLQHCTLAPMQLEEIIRLQDHVVEFQEGERRLALETLLDRLKGEHAVDGEMPAIVAQER